MENNDFELVTVAQEGNEEAYNYLYNKYKPIVIKKSKNAIIQVKNSGIDINDIMQEAFIGFNEAINNFSQDNKVPFYSFACLCIDRQIINFLRKSMNNTNNILNFAVSIDDNLENILSNDCDVEGSILNNSEKKSLMSSIKHILTPFENRVFDLKIKGYTNEEIAKELNKDIKSIYNSLNRIRYKIKNYVKNDN